MSTKIEEVNNSYGRCLANGDFLGKFYEVFLESHPDISRKFSETDFEQQKKLLRHGINLIIMYANDNIAGEMGLERIKKSHNHKNLNIQPEYYTYWKKSLLETIKQFDEKINRDLENKWDDVLQRGIDFIVAGYRKN